MKVAVFADVHGNYVNLLSFYESVRTMEIDSFICLGDLCNYYPDNMKVIDFVINKDIRCILGNHDQFYLSGKSIGSVKKAAYNFDEAIQASKKHVNFLSSLPLKYEMNLPDASILFCHASPSDFLNGYVYPDTELKTFESVPHRIIFMGHTHRQFLRKHGDKLFCNVGSIGMPRDNGSLMGFALLDTESKDVKLYRKKIDVFKVRATYETLVNDDVINLMDRREPLNYSYTLIA